jgi:adenosine deaminase
MRYRPTGLPVAPATDDPVVSRIDLTIEYAFATTQYGLRYRALKNLARASLAMRSCPAAAVAGLATCTGAERPAHATPRPPDDRAAAVARCCAQAQSDRSWRQEIGTST